MASLSEYGESKPDAKVPLILKGSVTKISSGVFDFKVSGSGDDKATIYLMVGKANLLLDVTGGWKKTMLPALLKLIDKGGLWGLSVPFFAVETTDGKVDLKTLSKPLVLKTPVAPLNGSVSLEGIGKDKTMKYTGNGKGRYLHTDKIAGWYFLRYGSYLETDPKMHGFDCITYVGSAFGTMRGMGGRGDGLASHLGAKNCDMEGKTKDEVIEFFKGDGKSGTYIAWWSTHCVAVKNGSVHEFSQSKGGYKKTSATSYSWPKTGTSVRKL
jgi:hypothetical protein